ncbi:peptidoglycan editing factor PgeF [Nocardioides sp. HDW12B]|uniref:peptidoglycan editing factor PgeF n=1 Tax=Nocardioides sp. HDW12B TaxID=2714939 RepID=UPI001408DA1B|nr:peptidoglycan editing factor PgeF [Nocardioides sp. HDW12B]QIK66888.1 peptidoglycan editing factor PgeF [Nocardioides sp. HDW12B]
MFAFRSAVGPVEVAFTDRAGGVSGPPFDSLNLAAVGDDDPSAVAANLCRVQQAFTGTADGEPWALMHQVHGGDVVRVRAADLPAEPSPGVDHLPTADGLVTDEPGVTLVVRVADCVPVLLADPEAGVAAALHVGRPGLVAGVLPHGVAAMRELGADPARVHAWVGPHVCGRCYEVPESMRDDVEAAVPGTATTTSWDTPAVDLGAGVRLQLHAAGIAPQRVEAVGRCTREDPALYSYRRDGAASGRLAGLVRVAR